MNVSIFKDAFSVDPVNVVYTDILFYIQDGKWKDIVEYLRSLSSEVYKKEKTKLPSVTFAGTFTQRSNKHIVDYSSLLLIDIDNLSESSVESYRSALSKDPFTHALFVSPSGLGLKLIFRLSNTDPNKHINYFKGAQKYLEENYALTIDKSGKDVARLCFVSYDPLLYYCQDSERFGIAESDVFIRDNYVPKRNLVNVNPSSVDPSQALEVCVGWVEKNGKSYSEGQRNVFLHSVACAMNRVGVDMDTTFSLFCQYYDLEEKEIFHVCKMAYFHNRHEFAMFPLNPDKFTKEPDYVELSVDGSSIAVDMAATIKTIMTGTGNMGLIQRIAGFYVDGLISNQFADLNDKEKNALITETYNIIKNAKEDKENESALNFENFLDIAAFFADTATKNNDMRMHLDFFDDYNILYPGLFIGVVGLPKTYKSVLASHLARMNAKADVAVLYVSGEMSKGQVFERNCISELNINWKSEQFKEKVFDRDFVLGIGETLEAIFKRNLFVISQKSFTRKNIASTINKIESKTGKKIKMVVIDGVTEFDWMGKDEIQAAIYNSMDAKELAKETGTCVIGLYHTAGKVDKHYRNTADYIRGANKVYGQLDAVLMTSLIVHPDTNLTGNDDVIYYQDRFYLRYEDKRGANGILNAICGVDSLMQVYFADKNVSAYEFKIDKK